MLSLTAATVPSKNRTPFEVKLISPETIAEHARKPATRSRLIDSLERLDNDDCDLGRIARFKQTLNEASPNRDLLDNATLAHAAAELIKPRRALEIGVRRGFTSGAIAAGCPTCELHLMDSWRPVYAERPNPGPLLVKKQLASVAHRGRAVYHQGNSHELMPKLFALDPNLTFEIIVVDGDHTESGADQDLRDAFPRVAPGGVLIFDDLMHPSHRYLLELWRRWSKQLSSEFAFAEYLEDGLGVGWAVRR